MKKLILILILTMIIVGCKDQKVLHTYYGDFSTDTLKVLLNDEDGSSCYLVHTTTTESFTLKKGGTIFIEGPIEIYYNPQKTVYYKRFPASGNSNARILKYNPYVTLCLALCDGV